jgi:hypothetical protein
MRRLVAVVTLIEILVLSRPAAADDPKADALIAAARASLGGETALTRIRGLTATGSFQRQIGDRQVDGDLTIDFAWPDRMLRTESMRPTGDATIVSTLGINGVRVIRDTRTIGGGPNLMLRVAPGGSGPDAEEQARRSQQAEMARLTLALLVTAGSFPVEYAYGGEAEAADGRADVIDVNGAGSFAIRLFLDRTTHRPLLLQYRGIAPRLMMQTRQSPSAADGRRLRDQDLPPPPAAEFAEIGLFLDDYRQVDGVFLPFRISRSVDQAPNEEWTFKTIRINPAFKADAFEGKQR